MSGKAAGRAAALLVLAVAALLYCTRLGEPGPLWDESYYLTTTARYETGTVQFASHPPLGLMLIAAGDVLSGLNRSIDPRPLSLMKSAPAAAVPRGYRMAGPRIASALFACLCATGLFLLLLHLLEEPVQALLLTTPFLFDTALIAHLRAGHLDAFELSFAVAAVWALLRPPDRWSGPLFGLACGAAAMVRLDAVLLLPAGLLLLTRPAPWRSALAAGGGFVLAVAATLIVNLEVAHAPAIAGHRDFVSPTVAAYHGGRRPIGPSVVWAAGRDQLRYILADAAAIPLEDRNGTRPLAWASGGGAITYRWDAAGGRTAFVALAPNRAAWLFSLAGVLWALAACRRGSAERPAMAALLLAWAALAAGHALMAEHRVVYAYHHFVPLVIGYVLAALACRSRPSPVADRFVEIGSLAVASVFLLQAPLALHRPIEPAECRVRSALLDRIECDPAAARPGR